MAAQTPRRKTPGRTAPGTPPKAAAGAAPAPAPAVLRISSRNYSSWSLRGFLMLRLSGLPFRTVVASPEDPSTRAELLNNSSSILLPCLEHDGAEIWDTLGIAEYLNELRPEAAMMPSDRIARARCRAISGEMHAGFHALRSSLPFNLRARIPAFIVWSAARADLDRIFGLWRECLRDWGGPWLFGARPSIADAMYAPVVLRCRSYGVALDAPCEAYARTVESWPDVQEWVQAALAEPEQQIVELELDAEF